MQMLAEPNVRRSVRGVDEKEENLRTRRTGPNRDKGGDHVLPDDDGGEADPRRPDPDERTGDGDKVYPAPVVDASVPVLSRSRTRGHSSAVPSPSGGSSSSRR